MTTIEGFSVVTPANLIQGPGQGNWSYKRYVEIEEDGHCYEVVDGVLYMSPAPTPRHQEISANIAYYLVNHVKLTGSGKVYASPIDVELDYKNVVQPDLLVLLNEHLDRVETTRIIGPPDLVIEIASPSTAGYDRREKQDAYAKAGVPEYWIIMPDSQTVEVLTLDDTLYRSQGVFDGSATLPSHILPELPIKTEQFFL